MYEYMTGKKTKGELLLQTGDSSKELLIKNWVIILVWKARLPSGRACFHSLQTKTLISISKLTCFYLKVSLCLAVPTAELPAYPKYTEELSM